MSDFSLAHSTLKITFEVGDPRQDDCILPTTKSGKSTFHLATWPPTKTGDERQPLCQIISNSKPHGMDCETEYLAFSAEFWTDYESCMGSDDEAYFGMRIFTRGQDQGEIDVGRLMLNTFSATALRDWLNYSLSAVNNATNLNAQKEEAEHRLETMHSSHHRGNKKEQ